MAHITTMYSLSEQLGTPRIVIGVKIPHPCGDPGLSREADQELRMEIVLTGLRALQAAVAGPTVFRPRSASITG